MDASEQPAKTVDEGSHSQMGSGMEDDNKLENDTGISLESDMPNQTDDMCSSNSCKEGRVEMNDLVPCTGGISKEDLPGCTAESESDTEVKKNSDGAIDSMTLKPELKSLNDVNGVDMEINASPIVTTNQDKPEGVSQSSSSAEAVLTQNDTIKPTNSEMTESDKDINSENSRMILGTTEESKSDEPYDSNIDDSTATSSSCKQLSDVVTKLSSEVTSPLETKETEEGQISDNIVQSVYYLKWFSWKGHHTPIVTQNENGPCPLLAIANVLILARRIAIPREQEFISANQLMEYIGDYILSEAPKNMDEGMLLNYQQNMQDAISIMYKLQTGIDVNVKFTGVRDFEFTPECVVFDILNIGLYHGWLVDPQEQPTVKAVGSLGYNQLVEKIIASKETNADAELVSEALLTEQFLEDTASQLTYHGICELNSMIRDEELCVFFRNNHFSTLYKTQGELFLLVTDQGYLTERRVVWETLANVEGDGQFVDEEFHTVGPLPSSTSYGPPTSASAGEPMSQEDRDYLIALSLQQDVQESQTTQATGLQEEESLEALHRQQEARDLELALKLQEEERQIVRAQQRQQPPQARPPQPVAQPYAIAYAQPVQQNRAQQDKCVIL